MQIKAAISPPTSEIVEINGVISLFININFIFKRNNPYLPSFKRTPASTIDPATGASTWALGSQRWVKYKGVFTRKAPIVIIDQIKNEFGLK